MTKAEAVAAVKRYVATAWPASSLTLDGAWRAAWAQSHIPGIGIVDFTNLVTAEGFKPRQFGGETGPYILRFPGRPPKRLHDGSIKCEGVS